MDRNNTPSYRLTAEALDLLRWIDQESWGRGPRVADSPERRQLKRNGLIISRPPNWPVGSRGIAGHGHCWYPTQAGREYLKYLKS